MPRIASLQRSPATKSLKKNDLPCASWISSRYDTNADRHQIPHRADLPMPTRLSKVVAERERLIHNRLLKQAILDKDLGT